MNSKASQKIFDIVRNGWPSHILLTAYKLGVFTQLNYKPLSASELAGVLQGNLRYMTALLDSLVQLKFIEVNNGIYNNTELGKSVAVASDSLCCYLGFHAGLESAWAQLPDIVKEGKPVTMPLHESDEERETLIYMLAMEALGKDAAVELASTLDIKENDAILDIGGGSGIYTKSILGRHPKSRVAILERPVVYKMLKEKLLPRWKTATLPEVIEGDYLKYDGKKKFDWVIMANTVHNEGLIGVKKLFQTALISLKFGGKIVILDYFSKKDDNINAPVGFKVLLSMITKSGEVYSIKKIMKLLSDMGFSEHLETHMRSYYDIIIAQKRISREQRNGKTI